MSSLIDYKPVKKEQDIAQLTLRSYRIETAKRKTRSKIIRATSVDSTREQNKMDDRQVRWKKASICCQSQR